MFNLNFRILLTLVCFLWPVKSFGFGEIPINGLDRDSYKIDNVGIVLLKVKSLERGVDNGKFSRVEYEMIEHIYGVKFDSYSLTETFETRLANDSISYGPSHIFTNWPDEKIYSAYVLMPVINGGPNSTVKVYFNEQVKLPLVLTGEDDPIIGEFKKLFRLINRSTGEPETNRHIEECVWQIQRLMFRQKGSLNELVF